MLRISRVRIKNYKSIKDLEIELGPYTIIAGENNSGKSNFMKALNLAFSRNQKIEINDFFFSDVTKDILIDVMFQQFDNENQLTEFSSKWYDIFGDFVIPYQEKNSITIRCRVKYEEDKDTFSIERGLIRNYDDLDEKVSYIPKDFYSVYHFIFSDSQRDLSIDIKQKNSLFNKMINSIRKTIQDEDKEILNDKLNDINALIMSSFPRLKEIETKLEEVGDILEKDNNVTISPVPDHIDDLKDSIQVLLDYNSSKSKLPIENYGDGTKSWLTILAIIKNLEIQQSITTDQELPFGFSLLIEEPESHLHPNAQKKVWSQLQDLSGQVIITTHSSDLISEAGIDNLVVAHNLEHETKLYNSNFSNLDFDKIDKSKITNHIIEFKSSIIFAKKVVLVEGITDSIILRGFYKIIFSENPHNHGTTITRIDGVQNLSIFLDFLLKINKEYLAFVDKDAYYDKEPHEGVESLIKRKHYDETKFFYTAQKDIENTLYSIFPDQFETIFTSCNDFSDKYINCLKDEGRLKDEIIKFLYDNKTNYPYELLELFNKEDQVDDIRNILQSTEPFKSFFELLRGGAEHD